LGDNIDEGTAPKKMDGGEILKRAKTIDGSWGRTMETILATVPTADEDYGSGDE